jgi:nucleoside-diphosphate-sugar epimerase
VAQLLERGHEVVGATRSPERAERLRSLGAEPVLLDLLDGEAVRAALRAARPDAIVHEATALTQIDLKPFAESFVQTNRLRTEGTDTLITAAREVGAERLVAQSYAPLRYAREGGPVKSETDPLDPNPPEPTRETVAAIRHVEEATVGYGGAALRYGSFYELRATRSPTSCARASCQSSAAARGFGRSFTWKTRQLRPCSRSSRGPTASTTWSTTSPRQLADGCRLWRRCSELRRRGRCPRGSGVYSRVRSE